MLAEKYPEQIQALLARFPQKKSAILHLMHLAQNEYGYLNEEAMTEVAQIVGVDRTHVMSLAGFYSLFYEEPVGTYVLEVCNDLACALRGADEFVDMASAKLGVPVEGTTPDGMFTLKTVMCLGACDRAPMLQCNLKFYENLDESKFDALLTKLRADAAAKSEPSVVERIISYATGGPETLKPAAPAAPAAPQVVTGSGLTSGLTAGTTAGLTAGTTAPEPPTPPARPKPKGAPSAPKGK